MEGDCEWVWVGGRLEGTVSRQQGQETNTGFCLRREVSKDGSQDVTSKEGVGLHGSCSLIIEVKSSYFERGCCVAVPDTDTLKAMKKREHSLHHTKLSQRAYSLPCADRRAISYYIQLR